MYTTPFDDTELQLANIITTVEVQHAAKYDRSTVTAYSALYKQSIEQQLKLEVKGLQYKLQYGLTT